MCFLKLILKFHIIIKIYLYKYYYNKVKYPNICYERTRDQGTLGSIAIAIVEPLGGHFFIYLISHVGELPRGRSTLTNIT
jgi:hypothetical protein